MHVESPRAPRMVDPDRVAAATSALADTEALTRTANVLDAVGDVNRLGILLALRHAGDLCVSDLALVVGMSDSAVSHALRLLRAHGLVSANRHGRLVRYRVTGALTDRLLDVVGGAVAAGDEADKTAG